MLEIVLQWSASHVTVMYVVNPTVRGLRNVYVTNKIKSTIGCVKQPSLSSIVYKHGNTLRNVTVTVFYEAVKSSHFYRYH